MNIQISQHSYTSIMPKVVLAFLSMALCYPISSAAKKSTQVLPDGPIQPGSADVTTFMIELDNVQGQYSPGHMNDDVQGAVQYYAQAESRTLQQRLNSSRYSYSGWEGIHGKWPDAEEARFIRKAAEEGDVHAQFRLALMYDSGQGVQQDYVETVKWLRKAAEQDFVKAQYNLGGMYNSGQGVSQDHAEAVKWYRKAAERGFASAQKNLGAQYGLGQGVPQNNVEAFIWSSIAAMSGDEGAINNRDFAASKLSSEDLDAAQKRVAKLHEEIQQRKVKE